MTKPLPPASVPFSEPADQLGCVVPDLGTAISEWVAKGVGPFLTLPGVTLDCSYRGRKSKPKIGVAFSQRGDFQIELIQPLNDEPSTYRDFLAAGGNGPHHHGWFCQVRGERRAHAEGNERTRRPTPARARSATPGNRVAPKRW